MNETMENAGIIMKNTNRCTNFSSKVDQLIKKISSPLIDFSAVVTFLLMGFITLDVFMRTVFNRPIAGSIEICELFMVVLCFAAFPYTQSHDKQLSIDLLVSKLSDTRRTLFSVFTCSIAAIYIAILSRQMVLVTIKFYTRQDITGISELFVWPFMAFATLMMSFLCIIVAVEAWAAFQKCQYHKQTVLAVIALLLGIVISLIPFWLASSSLGMPKVALGGLSFLYLIGLAMLGMSIGYAMLVTGVQVLLLIMPNMYIALSLIGATPYYSTGSIMMVVVPMFVLMGELALFGNISAALFNACKVWMGKTPGGLAISSIGGCAGFAAVCGDTWVTALTMSSVAMPAMEKNGYNKSFAAACLCIGGPLGILIPPSYGFIIYAIVTEASVGKLFMAGLIPGILLAILLSVIIYIRVKITPSLAPLGESYTWKEKFRATLGIIPMLGLFSIIIGGILSGIFTPNEGGAVASFACLIYTISLGNMSWKRLRQALHKTCDITSKGFIIFIGVGILGYALSASRFPTSVSTFIMTLGLAKYGVLFAIVVMFSILGCMMNATPMLLLALPAIFPTVQALGFDVIWFGVICVIMMELSAVTPPVGLVVYALSSVVKDVPVASIFYHLLPLYLGIFLLLILLVIFPDIALFLPNLLFTN